jgi:hypothetical protein
MRSPRLDNDLRFCMRAIGLFKLGLYSATSPHSLAASRAFRRAVDELVNFDGRRACASALIDILRRKLSVSAASDD